MLMTSCPGDQTPDELLLHFVDRLPTTIRDVILARCCMAFGRLDRRASQDLFATFRAILTGPGGAERVYMCAKMTAVVELALYEIEGGDHAAAREALPEIASERFSDLDLTAPLVRKHWRAAREEFMALRSRLLDTGSLHAMLVHASGRRDEAARTSDGKWISPS
jgi:hypothetical protein